MAIVSLTVRRKRELVGKSGKNYDSVVFGVDDTTIKLSEPSICKKDGTSDGLVNAMVDVVYGNKVQRLWVTQTVADIIALS